uniref:Uncharacterized protein n=1 Tax=Romanomermis culicivorax TaxID=13658 RepID=A0A915JUA9_ROMCU
MPSAMLLNKQVATRSPQHLLPHCLQHAQQQPVAAAKQPPQVANALGETLRSIKDDVSIIEASLFPTSTALRSLKIGFLREVHLCGGLVTVFPSDELILSDNDDEE